MRGSTGVVRGGWRSCGGGEWANYWLGSSRRWQEIKNHGRILVYTSTTPPTIPAPNNQTPTKIVTARDEDRNTMTQHRTGMLDWSVPWLIHPRADGCNFWGVGWSKKQNKKGEEKERRGSETANGKMTLTRQYKDLLTNWVNRCLVCSLVLLWWAFLCIPLTLHVEIQHHEISTVHWPQWYSCHCKILHFRATLTKCSIQLLLYNWHVYGGKNRPQYFEFHTQLNT